MRVIPGFETNRNKDHGMGGMSRTKREHRILRTSNIDMATAAMPLTVAETGDSGGLDTGQGKLAGNRV
jgi:hypothetical protein